MAKNSLDPHSVLCDNAIVEFSTAYLKQIEELLKHGSKPAVVTVSVGFSVKRGQDPNVVLLDEAKHIKYGK
jgi:hypothetical protein